MKFLSVATIFTLAIAMFTAGACAQTGPDILSAGPITATVHAKGGMMALRVEDDAGATPVKGAPFCATVTTEHTQPFADGNRIHSTDSSSLCRDNEGRTRREAGLNLMAAGSQSATRLITITDPVAGVRYMLDPDNKVAHKSNIPSTAGAPGMPLAGGPAEKRMFVMKSSDGPQVMTSNMFFKTDGHDHNDAARSTEDLGTQSFGGIRAAGKRMTTTIPAGEMGNDKPFVITSERWYSQDMKATVMTKHNDPWAGELKTELTGVNAGEPDPSLFTVPGDYKVVDDKGGLITIQMAPLAPPSTE